MQINKQACSLALSSTHVCHVTNYNEFFILADQSGKGLIESICWILFLIATALQTLEEALDVRDAQEAAGNAALASKQKRAANNQGRAKPKAKV